MGKGSGKGGKATNDSKSHGGGEAVKTGKSVTGKVAQTDKAGGAGSGTQGKTGFGVRHNPATIHNRERQLNQNNDRFHQSRGLPGRPEGWKP